MLDDASSTEQQGAPEGAQRSRVGLLIDVTGDHFTARLDSVKDSDAPASHTNSIGQVGSYFLVRQEGASILVMVERSYRIADKQGRAAHMVHLTPLGEISTAGDFTRGVSRYPISGAELHRMEESGLKAIFSGYGDKDFKVGQLTSFDSIGVHLDASAFFGRHAAILGQSGSGKSWTVTSLIQAALKSMPNAHIILLDMHGEYGDKDVDGVVAPPPTRCAVFAPTSSNFPIGSWRSPSCVNWWSTTMTKMPPSRFLTCVRP